jgi:selenophosphate synthase
MNIPMIRLTSLAHGGGCGCKLAPSVLQQLLSEMPAAQPFQQLLVGTETGDDAAVWQLDDGACVLPAGFPDWRRDLLTDPQTSGGLLIACEPGRAEDILSTIVAAGHPHASIIGQVDSGDPAVRII